MIKMEFWHQVKSEVSKVKWPSKDEIIKLSTMVIGVSLAMAVFIGVLDLLFTNLLEYLVTR